MHNQLSSQQRAIVEQPHTSKHMLVLAAPGSGKTRIITERVAHLLAIGAAEPEQITVMTFTEKAAATLVERLDERLGGAAQGIRAGTIHNISNRLLEEHGATIGLRIPFRIYETQRQQEALRLAATSLGLPIDDRRMLFSMHEAISQRKQLGLAADAQRHMLPHDSDAVLAFDSAYRAVLKAHNALDFDDLMFYGNILLQDAPELIAQIRKGVRYLFIDEFHDLSPEQFTFFCSLLPPIMPNRQVMVVADPNQAIYGWRDADAAHMIGEYQRRYRPNVFQLVENYRSTGTIVQAAQHLITAEGAIAVATSVRPVAEPIDIVTCCDEPAEAEWVARQIERARQSGRYSYGDIALLYRSNNRADILEATLLRSNIPLRREQGNRFFNDPDVQATLRYLSLVQALSDEQFEPALHWPRVLVDELTMAQLQRLAREKKLPLSTIARHIDQYGDAVSPLTRTLIQDFLAIFDQKLAHAAEEPIGALVPRLLMALRQRCNPIAATTRENLKGILESLTRPLSPMVELLVQAIAAQRPIVVAHAETVDSTAGAVILCHILTHYLRHPTTVQAGTTGTAANAFIISFGQSRPGTVDGCSLDVYQSPLKTLEYSISTQAWRIGQLLLMRYERQRDGQFVLFDLETTGTHTRTTEILELAALEVQAGRETERSFHALSRPRGRISPHASQVHGISIDQVDDKPSIDNVLPEYLTFLGEATLVGHNIAEFDYPILRRVADDLKLAVPPGPIIDTCRLARRLLPDVSHRLQALASMFGYRDTQTHRALDDVRLNAKVFFHLLDMLDSERGLDIASEALELVALGIRASGVPLSDYNLWLAQAGGRATACGLGAELQKQLQLQLTSTVELKSAAQWLQQLPHTDAEEERRWNELDQRWTEVLERYQNTFPDQSLAAFLDYVKLASTIDDQGVDDDRVTLMTIHSSKGKEWPLVFIVGAEDGSIPFYRAATKAEIEEERRILYVAITRAKERLCLVQVEHSKGYVKKPGRFLQNFPEELLRHRSIKK